MYTLLVFLFKDVEFPQVALLGAFFALTQKEKRTNYYKNKCFKNTMLVPDVCVWLWMYLFLLFWWKTCIVELKQLVN